MLGDRVLQRGSDGDDVVELQLRLSGFRGTTWDGDFGPGTELQVNNFQTRVMGMQAPTGVVDANMVDALQSFAARYPVDFDAVRCPCNECEGFGNGRFANEYREGKPEVEAYHKKEYAGVHKAILHAYRGACFHLEQAGFPLPGITSGYRCWIHNGMKGRTSTNHMGKALDIDFPPQPGEDKRDDGLRCDAGRGILIEQAGFQEGWGASNRKALEPSRIAPTWIHMDVRCYSASQLDDRFFVKDSAALDAL